MSKTITRNRDNISIYLFADGVAVDVQSGKIVVGDSSNPEMIIMDCNSSNCTLHTGVTAPDDWYGHSHIFDGTSWAANSMFDDPRISNRIKELERLGYTITAPE